MTVDYEARRADFKKKTPLFSRPRTEQEWREGLLRAQRSCWRVEKLEALRAQSLRELSRLHVPHAVANPIFDAPDEDEEEEVQDKEAEARRAAGLPSQFGEKSGKRRGGNAAEGEASRHTSQRGERNQLTSLHCGEEAPGQEIAMDEDSRLSLGTSAPCSSSDFVGEAYGEADTRMQPRDAAHSKTHNSRRQWPKKQREQRSVSSFASMLAIPKPIVIPELFREKAQVGQEPQNAHASGNTVSSQAVDQTFLPGFSAPEDWYVYLRPEGRRCLLVMHDGMGAIVDKRGIVRGLLNPQPFHERFEEAQRKAVASWHAHAAPQARERREEVSSAGREGSEEPNGAAMHSADEGGREEDVAMEASCKDVARRRRPRRAKQCMRERNALQSQPKWAACPRCLSSWNTSGWGSCARGFTALECVWTNSHDLRWAECLESPAASLGCAKETVDGCPRCLRTEGEGESVQERKVREIFLEREREARNRGEASRCSCCCFSLIFVTDVLWWNDCMLGNAETTCRQFLLRSRFEEMDVGASRCPLQLLPLQDCSAATLEHLYRSQLQPWPSDSLVFLHREAPYVEALSDFCLSWRDAHLSRFHVDESLGPRAMRNSRGEAQIVCLRLTTEGTLVTEDGIVLASTVDAETLREHALRPRNLVRCAVAGIVLSAENGVDGGTGSRAEGVRVLARVRPHVRLQADSFARIVDQFLKKRRENESGGDTVEAAQEPGVSPRRLSPFESLLALLFPSTPGALRLSTCPVEACVAQSEDPRDARECRER
ncbi:conserved hypothetical protein [Neospora caninum Liverpool]|uniref:Snurportin-1 n=1 Tax=Neospora caninum (strain Liverpool) TaxID=572307 RepID=F0VF31_NEOCL|nr:conserved hypothetical protein [Neospora caninum Liverpool]CBZ52325.1 conserved hypothetical protein [Neospora caninum Liverpool]CEL66293.1 TPA: hypothetical protein BN1204_021130 [Neospora caninum Liverpool]|eukprot:XP_003882357.1 conserved hypothetical protein [Neospora caninum Liverpool]